MCISYSVSLEDSSHEVGRNLQTFGELNRVSVSANDIYYAVISRDEPLSKCRIYFER